MATTLTSKNVETASGVVLSMPFNYDATNYYPLVQTVPGEGAGCSVYQLAAAATTNATVIKATPGMVYGFSLFHVNDAPVYVTFYDSASAPTPDTTTIKMKQGVQAPATAALGYGQTFDFPLGIVFSTGISIAVHKGIATSSAVDVSEVLLTVTYK
jgi:hypothetical protein